MRSLLHSVFGSKVSIEDPGTSSSEGSEEPPSEVIVDDAPAFAIAQHIVLHEGYPVLDWQSVTSWVSRIASTEQQNRAWLAVERAWLLHVRVALGTDFRLDESSSAMLLSSLERNVARATLEYMGRTLQRVINLLDGIALMPSRGKDLLLVLDDDASYYRYVSYYYPDEGEFAPSGGMHIDAGCSHYVTVKNDLRAIEPVIAHEMTHGCLAHLPLPAWLNEGLAVNIERRLSPTPAIHTPQQLRAKHLAFWGDGQIQEFWSGKSFLRTDDGNLLSYDLARLLVEHLSQRWERFRAFVLAANAVDGGQGAAREHLELDLGEFVCALLDRRPEPTWMPDPGLWQGEPEQGRLCKTLAGGLLS